MAFVKDQAECSFGMFFLFIKSSLMQLDAHFLFYRVKHLVNCIARVVSVLALSIVYVSICVVISNPPRK